MDFDWSLDASSRLARARREFGEKLARLICMRPPIQQNHCGERGQRATKSSRRVQLAPARTESHQVEEDISSLNLVSCLPTAAPLICIPSHRPHPSSSGAILASVIIPFPSAGYLAGHLLELFPHPPLTLTAPSNSSLIPNFLPSILAFACLAPDIFCELAQSTFSLTLSPPL